MQLDQAWLMQQGEDAMLLHAIDVAFARVAPPRLAVAVSGGGDSMALLHLYSRWAAQTGASVFAVTVNHGLRPEAATEADQVAAWCEALSIPHHVLHWQGWDGTGNLQAEARAARYRLMAEWAKSNAIDAIALGHTRDDIAETFLMRLARKSGLEGLAAMQPRFRRHDIDWVRPLWQQSRDRLRQYLHRQEQPWIDDPSNDDARFERVRARQVLETLVPLGIDAEGLMHTAFSLHVANAALEQVVREAVASHVSEDRGDVLIARRPPVSQEIMRRLMNRALQWIGGDPYPPRWSALIDMEAEVASGQTRSLAGCLVRQDARHLRFCREFNAVRDTKCPTTEIWDRRWQLDGPHAPDLELRALGESVKECPDWRETGLPRASLMASPSVWRGETLVAAPLAGYNRDWSAKIVASFTTYLLSH